MKISKEIEEELKLHLLVKPAIVLNNKWKWKWSDDSLGIRENEKQEFEHFLKNSLSVLPYYLQKIDKITDTLSKKKSLDKHQLDAEVFMPFLALRHFVRHSYDVMYTIHINWDHEIFVDREEDVFVPHEESSSRFYQSPLYLRWELGQLQPM